MSEFTSFTSTNLEINDIILYPRKKSVHLILKDGSKIVLKERALSQLLSHAELTKRAFFSKDKTDEDRKTIIKNIIESKPLSIDVVKLETKVYYAYRVVTPEYTPIPHRILFDFTKRYLEDTFNITTDPIVRKYQRRTVAYFNIKQITVEGHATFNVGIAISNANTGDHSVKIYTYLALDRETLELERIGSRVRVIHVSNPERILERVGTAIDQAIDWINSNTPNLAEAIRRLFAPMTREEIREWLLELEQTLPHKYRNWFERVYEKNRKQYKESWFALWKTITHFANRLEDKNFTLSQKLRHHSVMVLNHERPRTRTRTQLNEQVVE